MKEKEYEPYGDEWAKEMQKLPKAAIIAMCAKFGKEKMRKVWIARIARKVWIARDTGEFDGLTMFSAPPAIIIDSGDWFGADFCALDDSWFPEIKPGECVEATITLHGKKYEKIRTDA